MSHLFSYQAMYSILLQFKLLPHSFTFHWKKAMIFGQLASAEMLLARFYVGTKSTIGLLAASARTANKIRLYQFRKKKVNAKKNKKQQGESWVAPQH